MDYRFGITAQLIAHVSLTYSSYSYLNNGWASGTLIQNEHIRWFYLFGFGALALVSLFQLFTIPKTATPGGSIGKALLSVPLFAYLIWPPARPVSLFLKRETLRAWCCSSTKSWIRLPCS